MLSLSPISGQCVELLVNGDFDAGPTAWVENDGGSGFPLIVHSSETPFPPQSGSYLAWLGGVFNASQSLYQTVAIPPGTSSLQVKGYFRITSDDFFDTASLRLLSSNGALLEVLINWSSFDEGSEWIPFAVSPTGNYAGQTVRLQLSAVLDDIHNTSFFFDTIQFIANIPTEAPHSEGMRSWASIKSLYR